MKTIEIKGHLRESVGSKNAKQLRREGQVPCVIYGGGSNLHFQADLRSLNKLIFTPNVYQVTLDIDGKAFTAVMREPQFHPVKDELVHLDFNEILPGKPIAVRVPVTLTGSSMGVKNGGVLRRNAKRLLVRGLIDDIPDEILIDITSMKIGDSTKVGDLSINGIDILEATNRVVVAVKTSRKAIAEEEAEAAEAEAAEAAEAAEGAEGEEGAEKPDSEGAAETAADAPTEG